jgi:hypothetical protein
LMVLNKMKGAGGNEKTAPSPACSLEFFRK